MKKMLIVMVGIAVVLTLASCAYQQKKVEKEMKQPINCSTASADLRVLQQEKVHLAEQIGEGVTAIVPIGLVIGIVTDTEGTELKVATGEYDKMIDKRIAEIKTHCGIGQ